MGPLLSNYLFRYFSAGHTRTVKAKKNILALFLLRAISALVSFLLVPLTLNYLNSTRYGIWLTLTSVINWVSVLDIGLGTGLRNKFAEAIARNDDESARCYVSTSYVFIGLIALAAMALFWLVNPMLHWSKILNTPPDLEPELASLAQIVFTFFCVRLIAGLIGTILLADQRPAMNNLLEVATNVVSLVVVYVMTKSHQGSLFWLGFAMSFIIVIISVMANVWFFKTKYRRYLPSFRFVRVEYAKELVNLGVQFFLLQMAGVVIFSSSNIIISQFFGPLEVTAFNIAFKYYSVASMAFLMVLTPFWSAYTDAFVKGDTEWINRASSKLKKLWIMLLVGVVLMTVSANKVYTIWVGNDVHISNALSISMGIYVLILAWSNIFAYFINSTGKLRLELWVALIAGLLNVPLALVLAKTFGMGSSGVILASCIALLPGCFLWPIQMKKLLEGTASGVWIK